MGYIKRTLNMIICALLSASIIVTPVLAVPEGEKTEEDKAVHEKEKEVPDENGHYTVEYTHDIVPDTNKIKGWPKGPLINSESAILMDMDTKEIIYAKNPYKEQYPASITKLLTVLVALDYAKPDDKVEISQASIDFLKPGDAHIAMQPGEIISMEDALYAVLFASANEVSYAVAENVGKKYLNGGYNEFIQKMNEKSKEIGCKNSHWVNANGLHDKDHYTSAYDMALIGAEIYKNPLFNEMMEGFEHVIPPTNLVDEKRVFQQHHKMTWKNGKYYYENCKGGKTGYTDDAQTTLVTLADDGERKFAAVLLYDRGGQAYNQTRELFDYGYEKFVKVKPSEKDDNSDIGSFLEPDTGLSLPEGVKFDELESELYANANDSGKGTVTYKYNDNPIGTFNIELTDKAYKKLIDEENKRPDIDGVDDKGHTVSSTVKKIVRIICISLISFTVIFIIAFMIRLHIYRKRKRSRSKRVSGRRKASGTRQKKKKRR